MRCPVCRASNEEGPQCRRCRADLSLLFDLETQRAELIRIAQEQIQRGQWEEVVRLAEQAHFLRRDSDSLRLSAIGWLMQRNFSKAWECYRKLMVLN